MVKIKKFIGQPIPSHYAAAIIAVLVLAVVAILWLGTEVPQPAGLGNYFIKKQTVNNNQSPVANNIVSPTPRPTTAPTRTPTAAINMQWGMKLVNETVSDQELDTMRGMGIDVISGEWGMDEAPPADVLKLLDRVAARKMKMVVNFSDGSAWDYAENGQDPPDKRPAWQKEKVISYVKAISVHQGIFGYDISNEAGENLPNGDKYRITSAQIQQASNDIRAVDPKRPILMRMHYWDEMDGDFGTRNPITPGAVDIVMLNLYSNYTEDGQTALLPNMVADNGQKLVDKIRAANPNGEVWISLGAFREEPSFLPPSPSRLEADIQAALNLKGVSNIGFFGWGPERYPNAGPGWYLPRDGQSLLRVIKKYTQA